jgi:hypothetical protein
MLGLSFFKGGSGLPPQGRDRAVPLALPPGEGHPLTVFVALRAPAPPVYLLGGRPPRPPDVGFAHKAFSWCLLPVTFVSCGDAIQALGVGFAHEALWLFLLSGYFSILSRLLLWTFPGRFFGGASGLSPSASHVWVGPLPR